MMDGSGRACSLCSENCELIHGNYNNEERNDVVLDDNPVLRKLISFFKVMIDHSFSKLLFLPPKFARQISNMVGERIQLEDITRKKWTVTLSEVDNCLAFEKGWDYFSKDHNLEIGDLLFFQLANNSDHFLVQIFDRTGCPRFNFSMNSNMLKRKQENALQLDYVDDDDHVSGSTEFSEERFHMINRGNNNNSIIDQDQLGRRNLLFDLSCFEKPRRMFQTESVGRTQKLLCDSVFKPPKQKERRKTTPWIVNHQAIVVGDQELALSVKNELFDTNDVPRIEFNGHTMSVSWKGLVSLSRGLEDILTALSSKRSKIILFRAGNTLPLPVLYHEGVGYKYIGSGWQFFLDENNFQAGDFFVFKLENKHDFIFSLYDRK